MTTRKISSLLAALAGLIIAGQMIVIIASGEAACLNQGCKVVENLTAVSPLLFNTAGLIYFLNLFILLRLAKDDNSLQPIEILLLGVCRAMTFVFVANTARQNLVFTISGWIEKLFYKAIDIITNIFPFGWDIVSDL